MQRKPVWAEVYKAKLIIPENLPKKIHQIREDSQTIVTLNGSFDLLHAGHLQIIFEAKMQGDILIVALNSDASIKVYKDSKRPFIPLSERLQMVAALEFVDYVTWFDETDPRKILSIIKPDVHVNGSEYGPQCIEADTVKNFGGRLHIAQLIPGLSTTIILKKIKGTLLEETSVN